DNFKVAVRALYPGPDKDREFLRSYIDTLAGEYARNGIHSKGDYSEFSRQYATA
ncbi:hypothetical protein C8R44DRAFT_649695, partial [Mycena epipterygia]